MSSGGGGGSGVPADTTNVQTIREAPEIEARRLGLMDAATELAKKPTSPPAFQVAPMATAETAGLNLAQQTGAGAGAITSAYGDLTGATTAAGQQFTAADIQAGMNPYIQNVVNRVGEDYAAKETALANKAIQAGAYGGGREGVGIAELQRQKADTLGGIYGAGYQSSLGELQTQRGLEAQTALQAGAGRLQGGPTTTNRTSSGYSIFNGYGWYSTRNSTSPTRSGTTNPITSNSGTVSTGSVCL